jgi:hypothetical protein
MGNVQGFSAITAALAGYLIYAVYGYLKTVRKLNVDLSFVTLVVLLNLTIVSFLSLPVPPFTRLIFLSLSIWYSYKNRVVIRQIFATIRKLIKKSVYEYWVFLLALILMFSLPSLIPKNIVQEGRGVNILAHYIGFIFGVFVPSIIKTINPIRPDTNFKPTLSDIRKFIIEVIERQPPNIGKSLIVFVMIASIILYESDVKLNPDSFRFLISALIQALATILAILVSVNFIMLQRN